MFCLRKRTLKIIVDCEKPKYVKGTHECSSLEEVYNFLTNIKGFAKPTVGAWLLCIAKDGLISGVHTARLEIKIHSDFHDYQLAQKIAKETGLIYGLDKTDEKLETALAFAKTFDKRVR